MLILALIFYFFKIFFLSNMRWKYLSNILLYQLSDVKKLDNQIARQGKKRIKHQIKEKIIYKQESKGFFFKIVFNILININYGELLMWRKKRTIYMAKRR